MHDLNPAKLATLPPGWHSDGGGLTLVVTKTGTRSWVVSYTVKGTGVEKKIGLGGLKDLSLKKARQKAETIRGGAREGRDPRRLLSEQVHQVTPTFGAFADQMLPTFSAGHKSIKTAEKWKINLQVYAKPIRDIRIDKVTSSDVLALLTPLYTRAPSMARELRGRLERVFSAAMALPSQENPYRSRNQGNPAARKDNLEHLLPKVAPRGKLRGPQPSMPYKELPAFMPILRPTREGNFVARCLMLLILTALRTDEVRLLVWDEIDFNAALIHLKARRMKNSLDAEIPLSPQALELLRELKRETFNEFVFPGRKISKPISSHSMLAYLKIGAARRPDCTVHGFRSSFRSWGQDITNHSRETLEFCLHHIEGGEAERAYKQGAMLEKRRAALNDWANYVLPQQAKPKLTVVA